MIKNVYFFNNGLGLKGLTDEKEYFSSWILDEFSHKEEY